MSDELVPEGIPKRIKTAEGYALKRLWDERGTRPNPIPQAKFATDVLKRSAGYLPQFFSGMRPLTLSVAQKFAEYIGCRIGDFSPRLALEKEHAASLVQWPFPEVDYEDVIKLQPGELIDLQGRIRRFLVEMEKVTATSPRPPALRGGRNPRRKSIP